MQGGRNVHIITGGVIPFNLIKLVTKFESCFYLENNKIMKMRMLRIGQDAPILNNRIIGTSVHPLPRRWQPRCTEASLYYFITRLIPHNITTSLTLGQSKNPEIQYFQMLPHKNFNFTNCTSLKSGVFFLLPEKSRIQLVWSLLLEI